MENLSSLDWILAQCFWAVRLRAWQQSVQLDPLQGSTGLLFKIKAHRYALSYRWSACLETAQLTPSNAFGSF